MQLAMGQIALTAAGQEQDIKGTVRITASIFVAQNFLPQISIDLVASDTSENLLFREADIALRMYRPEQLDVVTRHLGICHWGCAARLNIWTEGGALQTWISC
jgi:DNA-binding transcriptional LysR family regulator